MAKSETIMAAARNFINFINKTPSPFHAVDELKTKLSAAGFIELKEKEKWNIQPLNKYFVTRNESTIIAFAVGGRYEPGNGFTIVGAHTDSPCLKVKPVSGIVKSGYCMVGVECYGGGIWNTWFDRDLTVGGRVLVKNGDKIEHRLVHIQRPILRIPHLAIHLQREMNDSFGPNKENHVCPVLATCVQSELRGFPRPRVGVPGTEPQSEKHVPSLVSLLCHELKINTEDMLDFELCLADTQPAAIGGILEEFIFAPRLDNLLNAYTATEGLIESCQDESLQNDTNVRLVCLFDNEEVGSQSAQGAASTLQELVLRRISSESKNPTAFEESIPKSYMVSADQAHAVHPNYSEKHESNHQPGFHKGIVIKFNANQRYATTAITTTILRRIAEKVNVPLQDFVVRNDSPCGSTIGPIMSAKLGIPTIDIGAPQLSMHSIREMGCTSSISQATELYKGFFQHYPEVFSSLQF